MPSHPLPGLPFAVAVAVAAAVAPGQGFQLVGAPLGLPNVPLSPGQFGTGVAVADFDGDGDVDVVVADGNGAPFRLFRNDGGMQFTDVSAGCGLGTCSNTACMAAGDIDNDGDPDLFVGNTGGVPAQLFINHGAGVFTEQAIARGVVNTMAAYGAAFGDFDRDGNLDLYLGNRTNPTTNQPAPNKLFRNTGGGFFADVTATAGVGGNRLTLVTAFMDYDEDGWPDLVEINDKGPQWGPNEIYRNNGNGTFSAVGAQIGANIAVDGMGLDFVDVFRDGGVDFYVSDVPIDHLFQVWNPALGSYTNATATYGLQGGGIGWAVNWLDYDNDGWQDLHVVQNLTPNLLFRNPGQPASAAAPWTNVAPALGVSFVHFQYTAAVGDFDDDGRVDLLQRFQSGPSGTTAPIGIGIYRNTVPAGNWLKLRTRGTVSNRDGLGARVEVFAAGQQQRQWVRSGVGFLSSSDHRVHFGLGAAVQADLVRITWPSGQVQHLTNVAANQVLEVVEPQMAVAGPVQVGGTTSLEVSIPGDQGLPCFLMLSFATSPALSLPGGTLPIAFDDLTVLSLSTGNPILPGFFSVLDAAGQTSSPLVIPPLPWLSGVTFYATAATVDTPTFPLVRTVFPRAVTITIQ